MTAPTDPHAFLTDAFHSALRQQELLMGKPYAWVPKLEIVESDDFGAVVDKDADVFTLSISTGTVAKVFDLVHASTSAFGQVAMKPDEIARVAIVWLILHELEHIDMGHFDLSGRSTITETAIAKRFSLVKPASPPPDQIWPEDVAPRLDRCLELQADHNAMELILDSYSADGWDELLVRAIAISVIMILIERHDSEVAGGDDASHPKAATRMFQLLGHVSMMWQLPERMRALKAGSNPDPNRMPKQDEVEAFQSTVAIPAYEAAKKLATLSNAASIAVDLGNAETFFGDVGKAQLWTGKHFPDLQTAGAQEWLDLVDANQTILSELPRLGLTEEPAAG